MKCLFTCFFLFGLTVFGPICAEGVPIELFNKSTDSDSGKTGDNGEDAAAIVSEELDIRKVDIKATAVRARLNPQFEFVLPTGYISEHFIIYFNNLQMTFDLAYSIIDSSVEGGVTFTIAPSFTIDDVFKGSLTKSIVIDEGINLRPGISFIFDNFQVDLPGNKLYTRGIYFNSNFTMLYRNSFANPLNVKNHNLFLFHCYDYEKTWFLKERVSLDYPIKVWEKNITGFYSLGGFDTIRGYRISSINAFRFFLISSEIEREILKEREVKIKVKKFEARIHQYRVSSYFYFDIITA